MLKVATPTVGYSPFGSLEILLSIIDKIVSASASLEVSEYVPFTGTYFIGM